MKKTLVSVLKGKAPEILKTLVPVLVDLTKEGENGLITVTVESEPSLQAGLNHRIKGAVNPDLERLLRKAAAEASGIKPETNFEISRALGLRDNSVGSLLNGHIRFTSTFFERIKTNVGDRASAETLAKLQALIQTKWKRQ